MQKNLKFDLKHQYKRNLELSAALALVIVIALLMVFKKFDIAANFKAVEAPAIEIVDIPPVTKVIRKVEAPPKPILPVDDLEAPLESDILIDDTDEFVYTAIEIPPPPDEKPVRFELVEIQPQLIGGPSAIAEYINKHNLYPELARITGVTGIVIIGFIVDKEGNTRDVYIIDERPPNFGFGEAGVKAMKAMKFKPGMQRDKRVEVSMKQPIKFALE
ncbi:MAG: TonB family protein [Candidatus Hatepunaea meridiana]|nr:TonB family protein [Candidatus Hatepunaea meridiana]